jgi:hypothetical protein
MNIIDTLLKSAEPSIRYKIRVNILDEDPDSRGIKLLGQEIKKSARVQTLLKGVDESGKISDPPSIYKKWCGAHWVLLHLAELGFPGRDKSLHPIRDQVYDNWLSERYMNTVIEKNPDQYKRHYPNGVPIIEGKARRCASQQALALWSTIKLGIANERTPLLAELLLKWQWPDGGWNCDRRPEAKISSFYETILPLRALSLYGNTYKDKECLKVAKKASEIFLKRSLFRKLSTGEIINDEFLRLHYPAYFEYDILAILKVLAECGFTKDKRVNESLDILQSKQLPEGGFPVENNYYRISAVRNQIRVEPISWGTRKKNQMNEWVTADALFVLKKFGRI